jgi:hypothetical protein
MFLSKKGDEITHFDGISYYVFIMVAIAGR